MAVVNAYPRHIRARVSHPFAALVVLAALAPAAHALSDPPHYTNPVATGDFPDPSTVRIGPEYWAATTANGDGSLPPILRSSDLVHWNVAGSIFDQAPQWTDGTRFWAPELQRQGDRYLAYYSARQAGAGMCVAVAESRDPIGPYSDRGPLVCQPAGSIDPSVVRNSSGWPFLIWKEDRNTGGVTTVLWIQPLSQDGLRLTGVRRKILQATGRGWEASVVEGPQIVRRKQYLYLLYSGNRCCGPTCEYAMGVARAKGLYGPWRRNPRNPILDSNGRWLCPGHGSVVQSPNGRWWMLYHAYRAVGTISDTRQLLLDPIRWTRDGWPVVNGGTGPSRGH
jgi:xylan 1,4-beta-xylosidase